MKKCTKAGEMWHYAFCCGGNVLSVGLSHGGVSARNLSRTISANRYITFGHTIPRNVLEVVLTVKTGRV